MINASVRIEAPPEVVFSYFIDPVLMSSWIGERAELDAEPGGSLFIDFGKVVASGSYLVVEPPHRVVFTWGIPDDADMPPGSTTVEVELVADGVDTIVHLIHRDVPDDREPSHAEGWDDCLAALVTQLDT